MPRGRGRAVPRAGPPPAGARSTADDPARIAAVCRGLDGMALAIELAAARFPSLGLDGLEAGLADRLRLLTGGRRVDDRHRSLRSDARLELRPAGRGRPGRAAPGLGVRRPVHRRRGHGGAGRWPPVPAGDDVATVLAGLAEQSLLIAGPGAGRDALPRAGDDPPVRRRPARGRRRAVEASGRHLGWCAAAEHADSCSPRVSQVEPFRVSVRRGRRRAAGRAGLGGRQTLSTVTTPTGWRRAGRAELRPRHAGGGAAPLRAGRRAGRRRPAARRRLAQRRRCGRVAACRRRRAAVAAGGGRRGAAGRGSCRRGRTSWPDGRADQPRPRADGVRASCR